MYDLTRLGHVAASLDDFAQTCAITVALKISDDSCKMDDYEKMVFMSLYDNLPQKCSTYFDETVPDLISIAVESPSAFVFGEIRKLREAAMDAITRPKMKAFKAEVRRLLRD
jgi:hypothetical protein